MPIEIKSEVNFDITPEMSLAVPQLEMAFFRYGLPLIVTSARDGQHKQGSFHYKGDAIDFRSKGIPNFVKQAIYSWLKQNLSRDYQLFFEFPGQANEHFHIEYDPKITTVVSRYLPIYGSGEGGNEVYDSEAGQIPIEAPLPGGYMEPVLVGETFEDVTLYIVVGFAVLLALWATR